MCMLQTRHKVKNECQALKQFTINLILVDWSAGDSCGNSTKRKTQQTARQRRLRLTVCPRKAPDLSRNQRRQWSSTIYPHPFSMLVRF